MGLSRTPRLVRHLILLTFPAVTAGCQPNTQAAAKPTQPAAAPVAAATHPGRPRIVELVSRDRVVTVTAGPHGALYSARTKAGDVIVSEASLADLRVAAPSVYREVNGAAATDERNAIHVASTDTVARHEMIADLE